MNVVLTASNWPSDRWISVWRLGRKLIELYWLSFVGASWPPAIKSPRDPGTPTYDNVLASTPISITSFYFVTLSRFSAAAVNVLLLAVTKKAREGRELRFLIISYSQEVQKLLNLECRLRTQIIYVLSRGLIASSDYIKIDGQYHF